MATVTSVPVLLFKMKCMFLFAVKTCMCATPAQAVLPQKKMLVSSLSANPIGMAKVYKFKFDLQPGSLTDQVAGEHQPSYKHP